MGFTDDIFLRIKTDAKATLSKLGKITKAFTSLKGLALTGLGMLGLKKSFGVVTDAAGVQEDAISGLTQQLVNNGEATKENIDLLTQQAAALQKVTKFGDEQTIVAQTALLTYGLTAQRVKELTASMQDFTAGSPQINDMTMAAKLMGLAFKGDTAMLKRYGLVIDSTLPKQEKFKAVIETINKQFGGAAAAQAKTYTGVIQQMKNAFGDALESIGMFITQSNSMRSVIDTLKESFVSITTWLDEKRESEKSASVATITHTILISKLRDELNKLGKSHVFLKYEEEIDAAKKAIASLVPKLDKNIERDKKRIAASKKLMAGSKAQLIEDSRSFKRKAAMLNTLSNLEKKYNELRKDKSLLAGWDAIVDKLGAAIKKTRELGDVDDDTNKSKLDAAKVLQDELNALRDTELQAIDRWHSEQLVLNKGNVDALLVLDELYQLKRNNIIDKTSAAVLGKHKKYLADRDSADKEALSWFENILEEGADKSRSAKEKQLEIYKDEARERVNIKRSELEIIRSLQESARQEDRARQKAIIDDDSVNVQDKKDIIFDLQDEVDGLNQKIAESGDLDPSQISAYINKFKEIADVGKGFDDAGLQESTADALKNLNARIVGFDVQKLKIDIDELSMLTQVENVASKMWPRMKTIIENASQSDPAVIKIKAETTTGSDITNGAIG